MRWSFERLVHFRNPPDAQGALVDRSCLWSAGRCEADRRRIAAVRAIEELLLERGVVVTYETVRCLCDKFGAGFA
jgi:hypothetical protein